MRQDGSFPLTRQLNRFIDVVDDYGLLFLCDPDTLNVFVGEDWVLDDLLQVLQREMFEGRAVVWETGLEWTYKLRISEEAPSRRPVLSLNDLQLAVTNEVAFGSLADLTGPVNTRHLRLLLETLTLLPGVYAVDAHLMVTDPLALRTDDVFEFHDVPAVPSHYHVHIRHTELDLAHNHIQQIPHLGARPSRMYGAPKRR